MYEQPNISRLEPYVPGEQPVEGDVIKLNTNENPYPPPPAVVEALRAVTPQQLRRYPPPAASTFRQCAATVHGVTPNMVIATNGGDELLRLAVTVFCKQSSSDGGLAITQPTYSLYETLGAIAPTRITHVPLEDDWSLPEDFLDRIIAAGCRLVLLVSPHAPSGILRTVDQLEAIARQLTGRAVLLVDEAYVDFASSSALDLLRAAPALENVLILRTLSKGYSLAGIRLGYGLGDAKLIAALDKVRDSYNTDIVSQAVAVAALEHRDDAAVTWKAIKRERQRLTQELSKQGYDVAPSESNFLLVQPPTGPRTTAAAEIYLRLKRKGILVRHFDQDRLRDRLRITVGSPQENDALLAALKRIGDTA